MSVPVLDTFAAWGSAFSRSTTRANRNTDATPFSERISFYDMQDDYLASETYQRHDYLTNAIKSQLGLPRYMRTVINPTKRVIDWWCAHILQGVWTEDGLPANGQPNVIPYDTDTDEAIRLAVQQGFDWGNGDIALNAMVGMNALYGNVLVEIRWNADVGGEVYPSIIDPRYIVEIEQSDRLDLLMYHVAWPTRDRQGAYTYGKKVTPDTITIYRDGKVVSEDDNPFGFVPAHYGYHTYQKGPFGLTAIEGLYAKLDEVNALVSQINDFMMKMPNQPVMVSSDNPGELLKYLALANEKQAASTTSGASRDVFNVLAAPKGSTASGMLQNWGLGETSAHIDRIIDELEKDVPEITLSEKLLEMQNVTKPGAMPLVMSVQGKFNRAAANHYNGIVKLGQMMMTIGGAIAHSGAWGRTLTDAQQKFLPFDLDSYHKGELNFSLVTPQLVPATLMERIAEAQALEGLQTDFSRQRVGLDETEVAELSAQLGAARSRDAALSLRTFNGL